MRGKVKEINETLSNDRITPAYAGKRQSFPRFPTLTEDHPRLCGEKLGVYTRSHKTGGSPPPMRGKGNVLREDLPHVGITPAYAGKSQGSSLSAHRPQDHPRLCGEKMNSV